MRPAAGDVGVGVGVALATFCLYSRRALRFFASGVLRIHAQDFLAVGDALVVVAFQLINVAAVEVAFLVFRLVLDDLC